MTMTHPVATALVAVPSGLIAEQRAVYDAAGDALLGLPVAEDYLATVRDRWEPPANPTTRRHAIWRSAVSTCASSTTSRRRRSSCTSTAADGRPEATTCTTHGSASCAFDELGIGLSRYARQRIADWVAATLKC
jgi:hypothetical protein